MKFLKKKRSPTRSPHDREKGLIIDKVIRNQLKEPYELDPEYAMDESSADVGKGVEVFKILRHYAMNGKVRLSIVPTIILGFSEEDNFMLQNDTNGCLKVRDHISIETLKGLLKSGTLVTPSRHA